MVTGKEKKVKPIRRIHKVTVYKIPTVSYVVTLKFKTAGCTDVNVEKAKTYVRSQVCKPEPCVLARVTGKCPGKAMRNFAFVAAQCSSLVVCWVLAKKVTQCSLTL